MINKYGNIFVLSFQVPTHIYPSPNSYIHSFMLLRKCYSVIQFVPHVEFFFHLTKYKQKVLIPLDG